jgi:hypothetical protein
MRQRLIAVSVTVMDRRAAVVPCSGLTEIFFSDRLADRRWAMRVCRELCPLIDVCLEGATARREQYGVWGGKSFKTRRPPRQPLDD